MKTNNNNLCDIQAALQGVGVACTDIGDNFIGSMLRIESDSSARGFALVSSGMVGGCDFEIGIYHSSKSPAVGEAPAAMFETDDFAFAVAILTNFAK